VWKWGGITFAIGIALVILETVMAARKKGGIQPADRQRILGIFWFALFAAGLVVFLIWLS
jgi:hypothetical protein